MSATEVCGGWDVSARSVNKVKVTLESYLFTFISAVGVNCCISPYPAWLIHLNFHPLEVVSRYRDPQLQVAENYYLFNLSTNICKSSCLDTHFVPNYYLTHLNSLSNH